MILRGARLALGYSFTFLAIIIIINTIIIIIIIIISIIIINTIIDTIIIIIITNLGWIVEWVNCNGDVAMPRLRFSFGYEMTTHSARF